MTQYTIDTTNKLREIKPFIEEAFNVDALALFGSVVRNDFNPETSDIDILVSFKKPIGIDFIDLSEYIEKNLKRKVDIVSKNGIKEKYFNIIKKILSMSERLPQLLIEDIIDSCYKIQEYITGLTFEQFVNDDKTIDAVVRNFEIIKCSKK